MKIITENYKNKFKNTMIANQEDLEEFRIEPSRTTFFRWDEDDKRGEKHKDKVIK